MVNDLPPLYYCDLVQLCHVYARLSQHAGDADNGQFEDADITDNY